MHSRRTATTTTCLPLATGVMAALLLVAAHAARAEERVVVADFSTAVPGGGVPAGWELGEKSGRADFAFVKDGGVSAARFRSVDTSFSLQKEVKVDLARFPTLRWKWKVTHLPVGGDFRKSATDDQAAQLFVVFSRSQAIVYVWSSTVPTGTPESTSPAPGMTVQVVVVRSGAGKAGTWLTEQRNVHQDYQKLFRSEPPPVSAVRLQINSQHTETSAESFFADIAFEKAGKQSAKAPAAKPR